MSKPGSHAFRRILSAATVFGLVGCGGGSGPPSGPDAPAAGHRTAAATPDLGVTPASGLPQSYFITWIAGPWGFGGNPSIELPNSSRGHVIDNDGQFAANFIPHGSGPPQAAHRTGPETFESSVEEGISPNGIIVGTGFSNPGQSGYILSTRTREAQYLVNAHARFISETGLVGGHVCPPAGDGPCIDAFHWNPASGDVAVHRDFHAVWMNNAGLMLGHYESPGSPGRLATVDLRGKITPVSFDPGAGFTAAPESVADDGAIFLNTASTIHVTANAAPAAGDAVVLIADCVPEIIGRGIVARPPMCESAQCLERTAFTGFSATGHAVGVDQWHYLDDNGIWQLAAEGGFHWNAREGTMAIQVGEAIGLPVAINARGVAIGALAGSREAFIWVRGAGGMLLRPIVAPYSGPESLSIRVAAIGDAGHLLVFTSNADPQEFPMTSLYLLTPRP